ncbi:MAG: ccoP2 [Deltaproteobacteria bacterium]|nr:ccoP2 [Deltaproteobacteria bacterium]
MTTAEATVDETEPGGSDEPAPDARLMGHSYDGIREYDNPLPSWWSAIFVGSIIFAGFYVLYFHVVGWGSNPKERYQAALASYESKREERDRADAMNVSEETLEHNARDGAILARGAAIFTERCASCHGPKGAGLIGPNLTDDRQIHGSTRMDLFRVVRGGAPGTAMVAWGEQLPPADVIAATTFVTTLRGKKLPGKAPEGLPVGAFEP